MAKIILVISVFVIFFIIGYMYYSWSIMEFSDFYTKADKIYDYKSILFNLPILVPAILGFWIYKKQSLKPLILYAYIGYLLAVIISYYYLLTVTDPLAAGMFFIMLLVPYSTVFSILLFVFLRKKIGNFISLGGDLKPDCIFSGFCYC